MTGKVLILATLILATGALSYEVASRLSDEAVMAIVGVFCGIVASIPVSIGLLIALTRERGVYADDDEPEPMLQQPRTPYAAPEPPPQTIIIIVPQGTTLAQLDRQLPNGLPQQAEIKYIEQPK